MRAHLNRVFFIFLVLVMFLSLFAHDSLIAQVKSKISGKIYDRETNEPLAGANIIIEGTTMGAAADTDGEYFILNVPPGKFTVVASMMGYETIRMPEVLVQVGLTTYLDFSLKPTIIEGASVTVIAERPVVQLDVGNSQTILESNEISSIPVSNFKEVLDKQVGIQDMDARGLFMRGQRQSEISLMVDGMQTREQVDEQVYTRFNPDEVEQAEISASGYDVNYGNATAGVINLVTKEGGKTFSGTFDYRQSTPGRKHFGPPIKYYWDKVYLDDWVNTFEDVTWSNSPVNRWQSFAHTLPADNPFRDRPELLQELYRWRFRDAVTGYGDNSDYVLSATFGGPLPFLKNTTFFSSYRREKNYYLYPGPLDHFFDQNGMFKITTHPTDNTKLSVNFRYTETTGLNRYDYFVAESQFDLGNTEETGDFNTDFQSEKRYVFENVEQVAYNGYGGWPYTAKMGQSTRKRYQFGLSFTHTLSPRTFYEVQLLGNHFRVDGRQGDLRDTTATVTLTDPVEPTYSVTLTGPSALAPLGFWESDFDNTLSFINLSGSYFYSEKSRVNDVTLRANLISQIDKYNQINLGLEFTSYNINKKEYRDEPIRLDKWIWDVQPKTFAFWVNDKIEFQGMVLNAGLRGDVRIPHNDWFDWRHYPWDPHFDNDTTAAANLAGPRYSPPMKMVLAPRLRISHPIGDAAKIYFNWGHYYEEQAYERQYQFYRRDARHRVTYGDPELPFKKAIQYEIGYEHNLYDMFRISISGYHKDVKNLIWRRVSYRMPEDDNEIDSDARPTFNVMGANRYMNVQGIEARLEKRTGRYWSAWLNYNLLIFSRGVYGFSTFYKDNYKPPVPFDSAALNVKRPAESRVNVGSSFHTPSRFGPKFIGFYPLADINLNLLYWWRQQPTFTYNPTRVVAPYAPRNNKRWKAHWGVNLTFEKRFNFTRIITPIFYLDVYNLFNIKNMFRGAFDENLAALERYLEALDKVGAQPGERGDLAEEAIGNNPGDTARAFNGAPWFLYLNPRQIWFGFRFEMK